MYIEGCIEGQYFLLLNPATLYQFRDNFYAVIFVLFSKKKGYNMQPDANRPRERLASLHVDYLTMSRLCMWRLAGLERGVTC